MINNYEDGLKRLKKRATMADDGKNPNIPYVKQTDIRRYLNLSKWYCQKLIKELNIPALKMPHWHSPFPIPYHNFSDAEKIVNYLIYLENNK
jgi:hypothetical protein